jgi:hypothetical protein
MGFDPDVVRRKGLPFIEDAADREKAIISAAPSCRLHASSCQRWKPTAAHLSPARFESRR